MQPNEVIRYRADICTVPVEEVMLGEKVGTDLGKRNGHGLALCYGFRSLTWKCAQFLLLKDASSSLSERTSNWPKYCDSSSLEKKWCTIPFSSPSINW